MIGSLEKRGLNSWRLTVSGGYDYSGKRIIYRKTIRTSSKNENTAKREAEKELAKFIAEVEKGDFLGTAKMTLSDFVSKWLADYADKNLSPQTLFRYKEILATRILPTFGHYKLEEIRPLHLVKFYSNLQEDGVRKDKKPGGLSPRTIQQHHRILSSIFNTAVRWQIMAYNPASKVKPPKTKKPDIVSYDEEQTAALLAALQKEPLKYKVAVLLALTTGIRRGELVGLEWDDVDFDNCTIKIRQAAQYIVGKGHITKDPKNESSKRTNPVPVSAMELLKKYRVQQAAERLRLGDMWNESERLFTAWNGAPIYPGTISNWFRKFLKRHGLPEMTFHGLRHTAATLLIGKGVQDLTVSALLGHADPGTTKSIYAKSLKSSERAAADLMESIINGSSVNLK